jgi:hypothetical protein
VRSSVSGTSAIVCTRTIEGADGSSVYPVPFLPRRNRAGVGPFPLRFTMCASENRNRSTSRSWIASKTWIAPGIPFDSHARRRVHGVAPQVVGELRIPITPSTAGPVAIPIRTLIGSPLGHRNRSCLAFNGC